MKKYNEYEYKKQKKAIKAHEKYKKDRRWVKHNWDLLMAEEEKGAA
jgi:hypothetical protein